MVLAKESWSSYNLLDMLGKEFQIGDKVARAYGSGRAMNLQISEVSKMENGKLYLDGSRIAIIYPGRLLIITKLYY